MIARYRPKVKESEIVPTRPKRKATRLLFTETAVLRLRVKPHQHFVWDAGTGAARGLCVLVNPTGTKTYFVNYRFPGSPKLFYKKLGRVGEITVDKARELALATRKLAFENKDPKANDPNKSDAFEAVFETYIQHEQIGRKQNSSAMETRGVVLHNCADLKPRAVATITYRDISGLLAAIRDGTKGKPRPSTAARVFAHLRDFFSWCAREQIIAASPMANMPAPAKSKSRDRFYSDDELRAIWSAADRLSPSEGSYVKLAMLLALRRDELAEASWTEFDSRDEPTLFTVPAERVKMKAATKADKKPVYRVPLPPLAVRILKGLRHDGEATVFPALDAESLKAKLVKLGAPVDFKLHTFRHTVATWLQNAGRSEWERGLVLNHAGGGSVTGGYSHGYALDLKRTMMVEWTDHVEKLVSPGEGVARLR